MKIIKPTTDPFLYTSVPVTERTNLCLYSDDYSNAVWTKTNVSVGSSITTPESGVAYPISATGAGTRTLSQDITVSYPQVYALSMIVKPDTASILEIYTSGSLKECSYWVNFTVDDALPLNGPVIFSYYERIDGWYQIHVTVESESAGTGTIGIRIRDDYAAGQKFYLDHVQFETGYLPTDVMGTTDAAYTSDATADAWSATETYSAGDECYDGTKMYEALIANSGLSYRPSSNTTGDNPVWAETGYITSHRAIDPYINTTTTATAPVAVGGETRNTAVQFLLPITTSIDSVALTNIIGSYVEITAVVTGGEYTWVHDGLTHEGMPVVVPGGTGAQIWFNEKKELTETLLDALEESIDSATFYFTSGGVAGHVLVTVFNEAAAAQCGMLRIGKSCYIGPTRVGADVSGDDYSRTEADAYDNYGLIQGRYSKRVQAEIVVDADDYDAINQVLFNARGTEYVYDFNNNGRYACLIVFGTCKYSTILRTTDRFWISIEATGVVQ